MATEAKVLPSGSGFLRRYPEFEGMFLAPVAVGVYFLPYCGCERPAAVCGALVIAVPDIHLTISMALAVTMTLIALVILICFYISSLRSKHFLIIYFFVL